MPYTRSNAEKVIQNLVIQAIPNCFINCSKSSRSRSLDTITIAEAFVIIKVFIATIFAAVVNGLKILSILDFLIAYKMLNITIGNIVLFWIAGHLLPLSHLGVIGAIIEVVAIYISSCHCGGIRCHQVYPSANQQRHSVWVSRASRRISPKYLSKVLIPYWSKSPMTLPPSQTFLGCRLAVIVMDV